MNAGGGAQRGSGVSEPEPRFAEGAWRNGWYVVPHEVTWRDLDAIGHVNNAVYFSFFEWARTKYWFDLHELGLRAKNPHELTFIVARAECDFRAQLGLAERIEIGVRIEDIRNSSFDFVYEVWKSEGGAVAATGKVVVVLYSWERNVKVAVDAALRARIERFQRPAEG